MYKIRITTTVEQIDFDGRVLFTATDSIDENFKEVGCESPQFGVGMSGMIWHDSVPLCPHIMGYFRTDIPPEEHQTIASECEECGPVSASPPPQYFGKRPGFGLSAHSPNL
jgi:hypothetical protein